MAFSRRQFLKLVGGSAAGAAVLAACRPGIAEFIAQSPVRLPEDLVTGVDNWYATLCSECSSGCGVVVRLIEGRAKKIEGNPLHPVNKGKLCVRGQAGVQALYHPDRIRRPMRAEGGRGSGRFREITWDEALDELLGRLRQYSGDTVVLATEPLKGHLALAVSRFAQAHGALHAPFEPKDQTVLRAAMKRLFDQDLLPDFDIQNARYLLSFGSDFLMGWISQVRHSRGYGEFRQGRDQRGVFVQVDSRFSGTAANADTWVPIKPGAEGKLALAIAYTIIQQHPHDPGAARALFGENPAAALEPFGPARVAEETGVPVSRIEEIAHDLATSQPGLVIGGGSAAAHTNGLFNLTAIYALNALVGNLGKPGGLIFNPPPPIREIAAPSYSLPFAEWQRLVERMRSGRPKPVNVLLLRNANLLHGLPSALDLPGALGNVPFIASFSSFLDDSTYQADLVLPAHVPLEDWGDDPPDPGPGFESIGFQQPVVRPFQESRGFGDILLAVAQELGLERELPWTSFRELLREGAQKLWQLNRGSVSGASLEAYWNNLLQQGGWWDEGRTSTVPVRPRRLDLRQAQTAPQFAGDAGGYPFNLVPFTSISLGDGRGAHLPWMQATPDPISTATWETWVEVNIFVARQQGLREGDMVRIESPNGSLKAAVYPNPATPPNILGIPVGQGHKAFGRYAEGRGANPLSVLAPLTDQETGALAWGATRVRMSPTGERIRIPKFEGSVLPIDYSGSVAQITRE